MAIPLMPKATAVWLIENTALTFEQIGDFCGLHPLEVQGIADGEVAIGIVGLDPMANGQLSREEIERCAADPSARLKMASSAVPRPRARARGARYTPLSKRQDRPDAIAWILRFHPEVSDAQIVKLMGTTKNTINAVRERTHWNITNIKPQDPVTLGICTQAELDEVVTVAQSKLRAREEREAKAKARAERAAAAEAASVEEAGAPEAPTAETPPAAEGPATEETAAAEESAPVAEPPAEEPEAAVETPAEGPSTAEDVPTAETPAEDASPPENAAAAEQPDEAQSTDVTEEAPSEPKEPAY